MDQIAGVLNQLELLARHMDGLKMINHFKLKCNTKDNKEVLKMQPIRIKILNLLIHSKL